MIQVLGSSHIFAMYLGYLDLGQSTHERYSFKHLGDFCPGSRIVLPVDGPSDEGYLRPDVHQWLKTELDATMLALTISGSDWLNYCLTNRPQRFDVVLPKHQDLAEIDGARLIPYAELKAQLRHDIRHVVHGVKLIRECVDIPMVYIEPPPPIGDNEHIAATADFDSANIATYGVTDPVLRRKLYLLHSELIAEACAGVGVPLIRVPPHAMTPDGFLPRLGYKDDWMHAHQAWGAVMIEHVDREIRGLA